MGDFRSFYAFCTLGIAHPRISLLVSDSFIPILWWLSEASDHVENVYPIRITTFAALY